MKPVFVKSAFAIACLTALCSCAPKTLVTGEPPVQREREAYLSTAANRPVTCTSGADCTGKWARALQWVSIHSSYAIATSTDTEIKTAGPVEPTTDSAFTVTRTPATGVNTYTINFDSTCGKAPACVPTAVELKASFNNFVMFGK